MKTILFIFLLIASNTAHSDNVSKMIERWKQHNEQVMDLKKKPEKYGLAPVGSFQIKYAALNLEIAAMQMNCNASNRKICSNQIAKNEVK